MKRLMKAALALLLAMALTLVACNPKVDEPSSGSEYTGTGSEEPVQTHGEPIWREEPITVDNAAADIRAFLDFIEQDDNASGLDFGPELQILNLISRPLAQLGEPNKATLKTKLADSGITVEWADDKLELAETISSSGEVDGNYKQKGVYNMSQDGATGDWSISVSRPYNAMSAT